MRKYKLYIGGKWVDPISKEWYHSINPATEQALAEVPKAGRKDVERAVEAARNAFDNGIWSDTPPKERAKILYQIAEKIAENGTELAEIESMDSGATLRKTTVIDVPKAAQDLEIFADFLEKYDPYEPLPWVDFPAISWNFVLREPIGVCVGIIPFNFPLLFAIWNIAPAIAMGNTVVLKPASATPCTAYELAKLIHEIDIPKGVVNVITGPGEVTGEELVTNPCVDKIALTGSTETGKTVMKLATSNIKKVILELGGKSPSIVLDDADIEMTVDGCLWASFFHQGQVCVAGSRLFVPDSIYQEFMKQLLEKIKDIIVGDPLDYNTTLGPIITKDQRNKIEDYIKSGIEEGARLAFGGGRPKELKKGFFIEPTVFTDVKNDMRIAREEIFGPVLSVLKYNSEDEAIKLGNETTYGLAAGIWSSDIQRAIDLAKQIKAGTVWINDWHLLNPKAPFGGYKESGIGRELGIYGLKEFTQIKHIHVDLALKREQKYWYDIMFK